MLSWELSNTLDASFCVRAMQRAIAQYGAPEIVNTDQGCQFTSAEFTRPLREAGIQLSMDGKGRCLDNVFVQRLWRTVKYTEVYLKSYCSLGRYSRPTRNLLPLLLRKPAASRSRLRHTRRGLPRQRTAGRQPMTTPRIGRLSGPQKSYLNLPALVSNGWGPLHWLPDMDSNHD
ncbi:MAG: transposase family protein [Opitutaceae bacterium]|nr:transposase family protein [Opitutaceae bacterium]